VSSIASAVSGSTAGSSVFTCLYRDGMGGIVMEPEGNTSFLPGSSFDRSDPGTHNGQRTLRRAVGLRRGWCASRSTQSHRTPFSRADHGGLRRDDRRRRRAEDRDPDSNPRYPGRDQFATGIPVRCPRHPLMAAASDSPVGQRKILENTLIKRPRPRHSQMERPWVRIPSPRPKAQVRGLKWDPSGFLFGPT
jgi:hypothetical protein